LKNNDTFKELYKYAFDFSKDLGYKNIATETAIALWDLLLSTRCKFLKQWIEFFQTEKKDQTVI
jgi:DCN1-like protein 1/2